MFVDRLAAEGGTWGITGVGVLPHDARMAEVMDAQDGLYTLVVKHPDGSTDPRVIGSITGFLHAPADPEAVLAVMTDPGTKIVSLTVTEGGYHVNQATGAFDPDDAGLQADLVPGATPTTAFGYLTEALARRREAGTEPFTVMSCDNIQGNGHVCRTMLTSFARLRDAELADWMEEHVSFPNSMVDRITPVTTDADREELLSAYAVEDGWPSSASPSSSGRWRTRSRPGARPSRRSACRWSRTSSPTS